MIFLIFYISGCCTSRETVIIQKSTNLSELTHIDEYIQDQDLLEAFFVILSHHEHIQLWDGREYSAQI